MTAQLDVATDVGRPSLQPPASMLARLRSPELRRALVVPVTLLVGWALATHLGWINTRVLVRPELVITRFVKELEEGALISQLLASLQRDLLGFAIGSLAGLFVGGLMGVFNLSDRLLGPTFHAAKQVALFAWIPLITVWFGTGEQAKVVFISLAAFYPMVLNSQEGIQSISREYVEVARAFEFSRWQVIRKVVFPGALPSVFAGLHLALIYSWLGTLGAEYLLAAGAGVGNLMIDGREQFAMDKVLLGVILAGGVGATLNAVAARFEARFLRWRVASF